MADRRRGFGELYIYSEDGSRIPFRNFGNYLLDYRPEIPGAARKFRLGYMKSDQYSGGLRAVRWGVRVRFQVGANLFSSPQRPDRLRGLTSLLSNGYRGLFPQG
jgi:hypothetical protein